jgi:hypothetical protein
MPALLALVEHASHLVRLEPAVRPGDSIACQSVDEVHLLRVSDAGHLGEHASQVAAMLRRSGWKVRVADCSNLTPRMALASKPAVSSDAVYAAAREAGNHLLIGLGQAPEPVGVVPVSPRTGRGARGSKTVCLDCGHVTFGQRHIDSHRRSQGHDNFQKVRTDDIPALVAQIRHAQAQASTPEDQEAPPEPSA